ncbi:MAG: DUF423 domain-containing protein [Acidobacteriota bacterium]|nr:DUF423 domain-containing protein [Acidobacteriota bacterium]
MDRTLLFAGSVLAGLGVALGAFGAHALKLRLSPEMLEVWETGVRYQMYHALALIGVAWVVSQWPGSTLPVVAGWLFVGGTILFSGSLYLLATSGVAWLGAITPLGGLAFLAGWACLAVFGLQG